ncbi:hypothetical protein D9M71_764570 [compost metagenome]
MHSDQVRQHTDGFDVERFVTLIHGFLLDSEKRCKKNRLKGRHRRHRSIFIEGMNSVSVGARPRF